MVDKVVAIFCFFAYWIDICEMFWICTVTVVVSEKKDDYDNNKRLKGRQSKALEDAKKIAEEISQSHTFNESQLRIDPKSFNNEPSGDLELDESIEKNLPYYV